MDWLEFTESVKEYQRSRGLVVDGTVGPEVWQSRSSEIADARAEIFRLDTALEDCVVSHISNPPGFTAQQIEAALAGTVAGAVAVGLVVLAFA